jgi:hypothetical protein
MHGPDYSNPLNRDEVMAVFLRHGIEGNPLLRLDPTREVLSLQSLISPARPDDSGGQT